MSYKTYVIVSWVINLSIIFCTIMYILSEK